MGIFSITLLPNAELQHVETHKAGIKVVQDLNNLTINEIKAELKIINQSQDNFYWPVDINCLFFDVSGIWL